MVFHRFIHTFQEHFGLSSDTVFLSPDVVYAVLGNKKISPDVALKFSRKSERIVGRYFYGAHSRFARAVPNWRSGNEWADGVGDYSSAEKSSLPTPQMGQTQSSGMSSNAVPGAMPLSGSPTSGSYT